MPSILPNFIYPEMNGFRVHFEQRPVLASDLKPGHQRLFDTDNAVVLPIHTNIEMLLTSADVLHSYSIPSLGLKIDCMPGHLISTKVFIDYPGIIYGQCAEICGANHHRMPTCIRAVHPLDF